MRGVSCVIAAYNEGKRIDNVLSAVENHPLIDEVIVVNDGSSDNTKEVVERWPGVTLINLPNNRGKSFAVVTGIRNAKFDHLCMLDADLVGIRKEDVTRLIEPVLNEEADITISLRKNSLPIMHFIGMDYISGERVFKKKIIAPYLNDIEKLPSFAIESFFNQVLIDNAHRIKIVKWKNVITPRKSAKAGFWKGVWGDIKMIREIVQLVSVMGIIKQNYRMHKLKVGRKSR